MKPITYAKIKWWSMTINYVPQAFWWALKANVLAWVGRKFPKFTVKTNEAIEGILGEDDYDISVVIKKRYGVE